jgi:hypothetical protein
MESFRGPRLKFCLLMLARNPPPANGQMLLAGRANRDSLLQGVTLTWTFIRHDQHVDAAPYCFPLGI